MAMLAAIVYYQEEFVNLLVKVVDPSDIPEGEPELPPELVIELLWEPSPCCVLVAVRTKQNHSNLWQSNIKNSFVNLPVKVVEPEDPPDIPELEPELPPELVIELPWEPLPCCVLVAEVKNKTIFLC